MDRNMPVSAFMTENVITLHPEDSLNIVEHTFASHSFHHIPIVETGEKIVGMVSKTDLLQIAAIRKELSEREFKFIKVKDFMTRGITTVTPEDTLGSVAEIFRTNQFHAVPVVASGKVIGIVTTHDVIIAAFTAETIS